MALQEKKKKLSKSEKKKSIRIKGKRELKLEVLKPVLESIFRFQLNGQHHTITAVRWNIFLPAKVSSIQQQKSRTHWLKEKWIFAWISHQSSGNELDDKDQEFEPDPSPKQLKMVGEETSQEPLEMERQLCGTPIYGHPLNMDTCFIWPVSFVPTKSSYIFSKINLLYTDNGTLFMSESHTVIYCQPRFTDTGYLHTVCFHCHIYVIIVDIVPCSNNDRFLRVNKILLQCYKKTVTK